MRESNMDKVKSQRPWLLMFLAIAALLRICQSQSYALDVTLQWDANGEPDLVKYKLYYKSGSTGNRIPDNYSGTGAAEGASPVDVLLPAADENPDPDVVEFTLHGLPDGQSYYVVVTAYDNENFESEASNEVATDYSGPGKVYNLSSSPPPSTWSNDNTVTFTWAAPSGMPPGVSIAGYSTVWDMTSGTTPAASITIGAVTSTTSPALVDGNRHYFHIRAADTAGNWGETEHSGPFYIDTGPPGVDGVELISGTTLEIVYSENNMQNAAVVGNYSFDNGVIVSGVTDVTGEGRTFRLTLSNVQSYIIYSMTVTSGVSGVVDAAGNPLPSNQRIVRDINDSDSDGMADDWERYWWLGSTDLSNGTADEDGDGMMDLTEYNVARANPGWQDRWILSPRSWDSDGDGISDKYETDYGMNPTDPADGDPRADLDGDGWSNYEEYLYGYAANNANSPVPAPPRVKEVIPAGNGPVPSNSTFAIRVEATQGINIAESSGVTVTVDDGVQQPYERNLNNTTVKAIPLDSGVTTSKNLWIAYYRSNETVNEFSSGVKVTVTFEATDVRKDSMTPWTFEFRVQTQEEEDQEAESSPPPLLLTDTPKLGLTTSGVTNTSTMLDRAAIIFDTSLMGNIGIIPYFGPTEDIPVFDVSGYASVGVAMNLLPPAVFPSGVTVVVPCPGYTDANGLYVYYYNGQQWVMACDPSGNVQPGGVGWMVPGSRVNHNGNPSWIEIKVYHFSAVIAATTSGTTVTVESGGGGGGCFISSIME
jgi:hypothetical protein